MAHGYQKRDEQARQYQADINKGKPPPKGYVRRIKILDDLVKNKQWKENINA